MGAASFCVVADELGRTRLEYGGRILRYAQNDIDAIDPEGKVRG